MRIAFAQMNSFMGAFQQNADEILKLSQEAVEKRCELIIFPELSLFGYPPGDLLERPSIVEAQNKVLEKLVKKLPKELGCLIGAVTMNEKRGKSFFNSALFIHKGKIKNNFKKQLLPVYDVFDESRHFAFGKVEKNNFKFKGKRIQVLICEDMWGWDPIHEVNPIKNIDPKDCDIIVNLSASPFTMDKKEQRLEMAQKTVKQLKAPLVYVNMVGGQDEIIFDGGSFALNKKSELIAQSSYFHADLNIVDLDLKEGGSRSVPEKDIEFIHQALVLGVRDYINKTGFKNVHLGLSGGIDSAVVACLAADAIGPQNVTTIALPTEYNSSESYDLALKLTENLGCDFFSVPINDPFKSILKSYEETFGKAEFSLMHENLQARLRGDILMMFSNQNNSLLLTTGNKSEYATGYSTLYGDMCGGLAPIADLLKNQVYDLARYYNKEYELIPQRIIDREPSAELRPNQKDSDSLPDYAILDRTVENLVCLKKKPRGDIEKWALKALFR